MSLKQVELNPEESKEFVELLRADAEPDVIAAFLEGKSPIDVPENLVKTMQLIADLETLQQDEKNILGKIFSVREQIMNDLTIELLGTQNPSLDTGSDKKEQGRSATIPESGTGQVIEGDQKVEGTLSPAEETKDTSTDLKTPS